MKYIEVYTFSDGEIGTDVYDSFDKAMKAHETSKSDLYTIVESVVVLLDKDGYTETISRWIKA